MSTQAGAGARFRASVDAQGPRAWSTTQYSLNGVGNVRPASEVVAPHGSQKTQVPLAGSHTNIETEALDRWFEDLSHYEQTLEEMAAASLDANFKEELTAIEQWFKVLSEAERTAALYSLLQSSTPLQTRFFITVLQQLARSDEVGGALMSPVNPAQPSLESQLEAKLASMKLTGSGNHQSSGSDAAVNAGVLDDHSRLPFDSQAPPRRLKASSRTSAPAHLNSGPGQLGSSQPSSLWSEKDAVLERRTPSPDPSAIALSPLVGGNWASMVNTPLVPLFAGKNGEEPGSTMDPGLRSPGLDHGLRSPSHVNWSRPASDDNFVLDDVRKFRRSARINSGAVNRNLASPSLGPSLGSSPALGPSRTAPNGSLNSPGLQQAAMTAQQNWRNGLNSPSLAQEQQDQFGSQIGIGGQNRGHNVGHGLSQGHISGLNSASSANAQLANLFALQQQLFQQQQQLNNFAAAGLNLSPAATQLGFQQSPGQRGQASFGLGNLGGLGVGLNGAGLGPVPRRSPRPDRTGTVPYGLKSPSLPVSGSGANPDEPVDQILLSDVSAWLRSLRLHKYTPNFRDWNWKDMVMLDDAGLQDKGVLALGARRKLLKVFETVRIKTGMALPGDGASSNLTVDVGDDGGSNASLSPVSPNFPDSIEEGQ